MRKLLPRSALGIGKVSKCPESQVSWGAKLTKHEQLPAENKLSKNNNNKLQVRPGPGTPPFAQIKINVEMTNVDEMDQR